jgi:hypothetical protein
VSPIDILLHLVGLLGPLALSLLLLLLAVLCRRLGSVTNTPPYYLGLYLAAGLMGVSLLARLVNILRAVPINLVGDESLAWALLYNGFPAFSLTLGLVVVWRYWSWLLAERD